MRLISPGDCLRARIPLPVNSIRADPTRDDVMVLSGPMSSARTMPSSRIRWRSLLTWMSCSPWTIRLPRSSTLRTVTARFATSLSLRSISPPPPELLPIVADSGLTVPVLSSTETWAESVLLVVVWAAAETEDASVISTVRTSPACRARRSAKKDRVSLVLMVCATAGATAKAVTHIQSTLFMDRYLARATHDGAKQIVTVGIQHQQRLPGHPVVLC